MIMNKQQAIMMVGIPGSGKSTIANELLEKWDLNNCKIFSSDEYRKIVCGDENDQTQNEKVFKTLYNDMKNYLEKGFDIIFDATNTTLKSRKKFIDFIRKNFSRQIHITAYVVNTPAHTCIDRDKYRDRNVGVDVIGKFVKSFQMPHYFEDIDEIYIHDLPNYNYISSHENISDLNKLFEEMNSFPQFNPHHRFTVGEHCLNMFNHFIDKSDEVRAAAGRFHDVGKTLTQHFDEWGIAHYYSHDSIGAYYMLTHLDYFLEIDKDLLIEILFYINWHMKAHNDINATEKTKKKYVELFGQERYDKLIEFAEADQITSGCSHRYNEIKEYINNLKETGGKYDGRIFE